jgi:hypothetical protein
VQIDGKSIHRMSWEVLAELALADEGVSVDRQEVNSPNKPARPIAERVCRQIDGKLIHRICRQDLAGLVLTEDGVSAHHREVDSSSLPARPSGACSLMRSICPIGQEMHNMPVKD